MPKGALDGEVELGNQIGNWLGTLPYELRVGRLTQTEVDAIIGKFNELTGQQLTYADLVTREIDV